MKSEKSKVYFTAYIEYLDEGIKSEETILEMPVVLRFLVQVGMEISCLCRWSSPGYQRRLRKTLRKFFIFAQRELDITNEVLERI